jgi:hypothetical protein
VCCAGEPPTVSSTTLNEITPAGALVQQVATGFTADDHTSLDADGTGAWILYLSGSTLYVSAGGARPAILATGFLAAAW